MAERIWISWNKQRRNVGLANAVRARLFMSELDLPRWMRIPIEFFNSWKLVRREKPTVCFVMNPSVFASWWLSLLAGYYRFKLVTDLHTLNIKISGIRKIIFDFFFKEGIRRSDAVIVTNNIYKNSILPINTSVVCIPDALPVIEKKTNRYDKYLHSGANKFSVLFISSFSEDEPLPELIGLDSRISEFEILVTGNWRKRFTSQPGTKNIRFLGFLHDEDYESVLCSVDGVMVLTTEEGCLCCGAYEAFSAGKPLILSGTRALRDFFGEAPVYTDNTSESILEALLTIKSEKDQRAKMMVSGRAIIQGSFDKGVRELERLIAEQ